jgi:hypothetical protein
MKKVPVSYALADPPVNDQAENALIKVELPTIHQSAPPPQRK